MFSIFKTKRKKKIKTKFGKIAVWRCQKPKLNQKNRKNINVICFQYLFNLLSRLLTRIQERTTCNANRRDSESECCWLIAFAANSTNSIKKEHTKPSNIMSKETTKKLKLVTSAFCIYSEHPVAVVDLKIFLLNKILQPNHDESFSLLRFSFSLVILFCINVRKIL